MVLDMSSVTDDLRHRPSRPRCYGSEFLIRFVFQVCRACVRICLANVYDVPFVLSMCRAVCGAVLVSVFALQ